LKARTKKAAARLERFHVRFSGDEDGNVKNCMPSAGEPPKFEAMPGTEFEMDVDLVLLAMGFTGPVRSGLSKTWAWRSMPGNVQANANYMSSVPGVFAAEMLGADSPWWCGLSRKVVRLHGVLTIPDGSSRLPA